MTDFPILSVIIAVPIAGAIICMLLPESRPEIAKAVGYASTMITFGFAAWMLWHFAPHSAQFQFVEHQSWIPSLGVSYLVGVDGISLFMIAVTALLFPIGLLASERYITHRVKAYVAWFLLLEGAIMGIFLALDLILFFVFWELMLVPMYFLILGWGSGQRAYAATKFFLYTAFGSAFLLASTLALGFIHQADTGVLSFDYRVLADWNGLSGPTEVLLFLGFMAAFAIKAPLFPFHTWLPLVHTEAPTAGSVVLAGVILKMGAYGLLRFSFELFPQASVDLAPIFLTLAVIGIIYGAIVAAMQTDLKRVIAYSSVAHMGFVVLGIFSLTVIGIDGAVFTMLSHPLTTGALFLVIGMLYERRHTREISAFRGVWKSAPIMTAMFLIAMFAGIGLPGFSGFIGEFLSLMGTFVVERPFAIVATTGVVLAAVYSLWAFQRAFTGKPTGENAKMRDVTVREVIVVAPLLALSLFLGIYPKPALDRIEPSVRRAVADLEHKSDYREPDPPKIVKALEADSAESRAGDSESEGEGSK
ncbi:MAG TPA: NADH-quinone oxidoreductase subunit M [Acidimicrobiia bacterium]|nr:NADH-quinone oxidoreductase subunit M [Acidimicrobiia bacterium]